MAGLLIDFLSELKRSGSKVRAQVREVLQTNLLLDHNQQLGKLALLHLLLIATITFESFIPARC